MAVWDIEFVGHSVTAENSLLKDLGRPPLEIILSDFVVQELTKCHGRGCQHL